MRERVSQGRRKQEEVLLTTLVDLLLQILFVFLILNQLFYSQRSRTPDDSSVLGVILTTIGASSLTEFREKWNRLIDIGQLEDRHKRMREELAQSERLKEENERLKKESKEDREKLAKYDAMMGAKGYPPCLTDQQKTVPLLTIRMRDHGLVVSG